ncbi:MAG: PrsW family glutamic-type intramembrane protease [Minisyncoccia bacterium]
MIILVKTYPFVLSFVLGLIPALIWMWFWLKEDRHPEPAKNLTLSFLGGMMAVFFVLPLQRYIYDNYNDNINISFALWASIEELSKFIIVYFIALRKRVTDEPVDDIIYLIVSALGFVALENTLFLLEPIQSGDLVKTIVNNNMRFLGASLIHIMSSATIGVCMGLTFYSKKSRKIEYTLLGIILAILLHTAFNLFIINQAEGSIFFVFGMVWVGVIVLLLLFEKVKNISNKIS